MQYENNILWRCFVRGTLLIFKIMFIQETKNNFHSGKPGILLDPDHWKTILVTLNPLFELKMFYEMENFTEIEMVGVPNCIIKVPLSVAKGNT